MTRDKLIRLTESLGVPAHVTPPRCAAVHAPIECTEVYSTDRDGELLGYAIAFSGRHDAYIRSSLDSNLLHVGSFDRHDDALETIFRQL